MRRILRKMPRLGILLWLSVSAIGCGGTRTVYVKDGEPVRLRKTLHKVPVWVLDKDKKEIPGEVDLQEGWYALPDPGGKKAP
jgi:hypothetical protein